MPYEQARNYVRRVYSLAHVYAKAFAPNVPSILSLHDEVPKSLGPYFEEK